MVEADGPSTSIGFVDIWWTILRFWIGKQEGRSENEVFR